MRYIFIFLGCVFIFFGTGMLLLGIYGNDDIAVLGMFFIILGVAFLALSPPPKNYKKNNGGSDSSGPDVMYGDTDLGHRDSGGGFFGGGDYGGGGGDCGGGGGGD